MDDSQGKPKVNLIRITAKLGHAIPENKGACGKVKQHTGLIAEICYVSSFRYDMVHKKISIPDAVEDIRCQSRSGHRVDQNKNSSSVEKNETSKSEVVRQLHKKGKTIHFASLMDLCRLKMAEFAKYFQNTRGSFVLWRNNVKDEEGCRAVFAEQHASACQMIAVKFLGNCSELPWYGWRNK